jgi:hypothetical protein
VFGLAVLARRSYRVPGNTPLSAVSLVHWIDDEDKTINEHRRNDEGPAADRKGPRFSRAAGPAGRKQAGRAPHRFRYLPVIPCMWRACFIMMSPIAFIISPRI